jgi:hypothetical protein
MFKGLDKSEILKIIQEKDSLKNVLPHDCHYLMNCGYTKSNLIETSNGLNDSDLNDSFLKFYELNNNIEVVRLNNFIFVSIDDVIVYLIRGYDLMNGQVTPNSDTLIFVGNNSSILIRDNGTAFYSSFN